ncbi:TPA: trypsin-like serine protease [Vibrio vulnificus]|uniref:Trypsin-like serine protease n=1 Tax=Vibrio vulnificus TaxID=672 RepID=A0A8H9TGY3_VIBVL|nr:trypsin-like serine protease [Vibrio vulnificus]ELI0350516.1 trypsin-like serine protease [Vibrio vulnificus]MCU8224588.1 trypsin-like serine protease [Vibrio vulnificus]HAS8501027.1 trypsin-like serine protease [Vibrio vulnificus]HAS8541826.1 trypsin-like serine protease [Vibrio vulnificus]
MKKNALSLIIPLTALSAVYSFPSHAVYNGVEVQPKEAPYMVFLKDKKGVTCTGTLIAPNTVLTALHCVTDDLTAHFLYSQDDKGTIDSIEAKVVNSYDPNHLYTFDDQDYRYDIAILELDSTPDNVEWLPVASGSIPLGAEVYPLGYSSGQLKTMPIPAKVVQKEHSKAYYIEAYFSECPQLPYYSNSYFDQSRHAGDEGRCSFLEKNYRFNNLAASKTEFTISVENPPLPPSHKDYFLDKDSGFTTKYSSTRGDSGGPLIYNGEIYGVASTVTNSYAPPYNVATYYEGFEREGAFNWIVDTVKNIQTRVNKPVSSSEINTEFREITFPQN